MEMVKCFCVYKTCVKLKHGQTGSVFFVSITPEGKKRASTYAVNRNKWMPNEPNWISSGHFVDGWYGDDQSDMTQPCLPINRSGQMMNLIENREDFNEK